MSDKIASLLVWTALTIGNFIYAAIAGQHWDVALERTFFQGAAILILFIIRRVTQ